MAENLRNLILIGNISINLYGILFALSFIALFLILKQHFKKENREHLAAQLTIYLLIGVFIGSRLFYVLFYEPSYFMQNLPEIFMPWKGGLSFHGGLAGAVLMGYLFCRKHKLSFFRIADVLTIPALIILSLGRIVNFIDGEFFGDNLVPLYDAAKSILIIVFLILLKRTKPKEGIIFLSFVFLSSFLRIFIDIFREQEVILGIPASQVLNIALSLVSACLIVRLLRTKNEE